MFLRTYVYVIAAIVLLPLSGCFDDSNDSPPPTPAPPPQNNIPIENETSPPPTTGTFSINLSGETIDLNDFTNLGAELSIHETDTLLIVADIENYQILGYNKGNDLSDNTHQFTIGTHSLTSSSSYTVNENRLNPNFSATVHDGTIWITNYNAGEVIRFHLDGSYLDTIPSAKFTYMDSDGTSLYAFEGKSIYSYSSLESGFIHHSDLLINDNISTNNLRLDYNRIVFRDREGNNYFHRVLNLTTLEEIIQIAINRPFSFEILPNNIVIQDGNSSYSFCTLDGADCTNQGAVSISDFHHSHGTNRVYISAVSSYGLITLDPLSPPSTLVRSIYHRDDYLLGANNSQLFFYDFMNGGFSYSTPDFENNTYPMNSSNEIPYSGWYRTLKATESEAYLLSEWPPGTYTIHHFDLNSLTETPIGIPSQQAFDLYNNEIYLLSGATIHVYNSAGSWLREIGLNIHSDSNLQTLTPSTEFITIHLAVNSQNLFILSDGTLNKFMHDGSFVEAIPFVAHTNSIQTQLFADDEYILLNHPLSYFNLASNSIIDFPVAGVHDGGYAHNGIYWYISDRNTYTSVNYQQVSSP